MSELIDVCATRTNVRWRLLASVSVFALIANVSSFGAAKAGDTDHPAVWIELGGQLEQNGSGIQQFVPPFESALLASGFASPAVTDREPRYSNGAEGKVSFTPSGSNWIFAASLRYGRSNRTRSMHEQTSPASAKFVTSVPALSVYRTGLIAPRAQRFADTTSHRDASYTILDFQVGSDVGLGLFGSVSTVDAGVRFAQFASKSDVNIGANPDFKFSYFSSSQHRGPFTLYFEFAYQKWHLHYAAANDKRSFHGIGPSLSWNSSLAVAGNPERGEVLFDWGLNGALLFGRQKAQVHHQTTALYKGLYNGAPATVYRHVYDHTRSRSVIVPNVGGFAGVSFRYSRAKLSLGYRADFFFGAMDGGIDTRATYDRNFYGPFATISIGLGG